MRKDDKFVSDAGLIESILNRGLVCRIGLCAKGQPYVVPMNYAFQDDTLYLHSGPEGKKIDYIRQNPKICFEVDLDVELVPGERPCKWGMKYRSVVGLGKAEILEERQAKREALNYLIEKYTREEGQQLNTDSLEFVTVIKVDISELTCKQVSYPQ